MDLAPVLVAGLVFAVVTLGLYALLLLLARDGTRLKARVARVLDGAGYEGYGPEGTAPAAPGALAPGGGPGLLQRYLRVAGRLFEAPRYAKLARKAETELQKAGILLKGSEFLALNLTTALSGAALFSLVGGNPAGIAAGGMLGMLLPQLYVRRKQRTRIALLNTQIGDTLVMVANSIKAGYSFLQSVEMVARESRPPIAEEFARALREMSLGLTTEEALRSMENRVGSDDLELALTAVLIQRQVGGNLAEILETIAQTIRERVRIKGEIRTLTAQGRISGIIISMLPVGISLFMGIVNPRYMGLLFTTPIGQALLGMGVMGQVIGAVVIRKIVNIEV
ncbi:MAG: type II secretion system F family protein [Firmicutes bacterium]|nr:type II secretion system F family protein [Bacillota bacterium]